MATMDGMRVMLVEDNAINQEIALAFLRSAGIDADRAWNGEEALAMAEAAAPDAYAAVLMDVEMPVMDGLTAMRRIRALPGREALPIIAMTGFDAADERRACADAGATAHLAKPFTRDALMAALTRAAAPPAPSPAAPPVGGLDLARLTCVDVDALVEMLVDRGFVAKLLLQFRDGEADGPARIDAAVAAGDREEVRRLAHRVKGVAGNLRAKEVYETATALERAAADGRGMADAATPLAVALRAVIADIDAARVAAAPTPAPAPAAAAPGLDRRLAALVTLLEAQDLAAEDLWAEIAGAARAVDAAAAAAIGEAVDALRYPEARAAAAALAEAVAA